MSFGRYRTTVKTQEIRDRIWTPSQERERYVNLVEVLKLQLSEKKTILGYFAIRAFEPYFERNSFEVVNFSIGLKGLRYGSCDGRNH